MGRKTSLQIIESFSNCMSNISLSEDRSFKEIKFEIRTILKEDNIDISIFGTDNYTFLWSNGDTTEDLSNITTGIYFVDIISDNNCFISDTFIIADINPLILDTIMIIEPSCFNFCDGQIIVNILGAISIIGLLFTIPASYIFYCLLYRHLNKT